MGDHDAADVSDRATHRSDATAQGVPGFVGIPSRIDDGDPSVGLEGIDEDVAKGVVRDRDGDGPESRSDLFDLGEDVGLPGSVLGRARDLELGHRGNGTGWAVRTAKPWRIAYDVPSNPYLLLTRALGTSQVT